MKTERLISQPSKSKHGGHILFGLAPVLFLAVSCSPALTKYEGTYFAMNCRVKVSLFSENKDLVNPQLEVGKIFSHYDSLADNTQAVNGHINVYNINETNEWVSIEKDLFELLEFSLLMKEKTEGYLNPFIGNLSDLWKMHLHPENFVPAGTTQKDIPSPSVPSQEEIDEAILEMNSTSLMLDKEHTKVRRLGTGKIDLGAIAKGYAAQIANEWIKENGFTSYLVDAGSSTILLGEKNTGGTWSVGIRGFEKTIHAKNTCIGTSGIDAQEAIIDGEVYSHIINPFTGSAQVDYRGVTLMGDDAGILDALSTSFIVMGVKDNEMKQKIDRISDEFGVLYMFYDNDGIKANKGIELK